MLVTPNTVNFFKPSGWTWLWFGAILLIFVVSSQLVPLGERIGAINFPGCTEKIEACQDNQALALPPKVIIGVGRVLDFLLGWPLLLGKYSPSEFWTDWRTFANTANPGVLNPALLICTVILLMYWYTLACLISGVGSESRRFPDIPIG